jgi:hypothetical protein
MSGTYYSSGGLNHTVPSGSTYNFRIADSIKMTLDASGNLLVGTTSVPSPVANYRSLVVGGSTGGIVDIGTTSTSYGRVSADSVGLNVESLGATTIIFRTNSAERARIDSSGNLLVGTTTANPAVLNAAGAMLAPTRNEFSVDGSVVGIFNRKTDDGEIIQFRQAGTTEGTISVSGTTVSYNGGHLSRWAQTTAAKDESLLKGTVLSNLDEMNVYTDADGNPVDNEQLNKVKVSDVEGDANVAGVFVNWSHDEDHNVDEINMAMTGDMIIRIAQGTTVARGDLLMSAGNGTAKPQGDDIVRSKTVAKVTSTHVTCTYADGSYCVPCVLMAC